MKTEAERLNILILAFGLLLGVYARFLPAMMVGFPVTDGGLFYEMAGAIQTGRYGLPVFVEYNGLSIPFAYPPLGFYVAASASSIFHISLLEVFRWMPAVGSVAFSIAFYPMASSILKSPLKGGLATVFFALLPRSISWYVMGGGITRVLGHLFLMLILFSAYKLFTAPSKKYLAMTILFGSGVVLSHPEASLHTVFLCLVLWIFFGRSKEGIKNASLVTLGVILLSLPFFLTVISRHGVQPYLSAAQTGFQNPLAWVAILTGSFADEKFVTLISALALLGLVVTLARKEFLLAVWLFLPAIVDPRSAASISIIPWAMLTAIGFVDIVLPGLYALKNNLQEAGDIESNWNVYFAKSSAIKIGLTALIFYAFFGVVLSDQVYPKVSLTPSDRAAMEWVAKNIPPQSQFLILTGETESFADAVAEWFPVLSKSHSIATIQGYEWLPDKIFLTKLDEYYALQACMDKTFDCLEEWTEKTNHSFEYILISRDGLSGNENSLLVSLKASAGYRLIHEEKDVFIFEKRP